MRVVGERVERVSVQAVYAHAALIALLGAPRWRGPCGVGRVTGTPSQFNAEARAHRRVLHAEHTRRRRPRAAQPRQVEHGTERRARGDGGVEAVRPAQSTGTGGGRERGDPSVHYIHESGARAHGRSRARGVCARFDGQGAGRQAAGSSRQQAGSSRQQAGSKQAAGRQQQAAGAGSTLGLGSAGSRSTPNWCRCRGRGGAASQTC